jgi:DNA-binding NarL/FixJ family response regulator
MLDIYMSMLQQYSMIAMTTGDVSAANPPDWLWCILTALPEEAMMREIQRHRPRIVVVDATAPADMWLTLAAEMRRIAPEVRVFAVGAANRPDLELLSRRAGIRFYLPTWRHLESVIALLQEGRSRM